MCSFKKMIQEIIDILEKDNEKLEQNIENFVKLVVSGKRKKYDE